MVKIDGPNVRLSVDDTTAESISQQSDGADSMPPEDSTRLVGSSEQHMQGVNKPDPNSGAPREGSSNYEEDTLKLAQASRSDSSRDADVLADTSVARMCISLGTQPADMCAVTHILDTVCMPPAHLRSPPQEQPQPPVVAQQPEARMHTAEPQVQDIPRDPPQPQLPDEQRAAPVDDPAQHPAPAYHRGSVHDTAPPGLDVPVQPRPSTALPSGPQRPPRSQAFPAPHPLLAPPVAHRTDNSAASHLLDDVEALLASQDLIQFYTSLRGATAHPHGALVVWAAVLTPLLSIFAICFAVSMALHVTRVVLGALSSICSASSHFTMQRLGAVARRLLPHTPEPPVRVFFRLLRVTAGRCQFAVGMTPDVSRLMSSRHGRRLALSLHVQESVGYYWRSCRSPVVQ